MCGARARRGFGLFDVLVAAALMAGFAGVLLVLALPLGRFASKDSARSKLEQGAVVALDRLEMDLRSTQTGGVHGLPAVDGAPAVLAVQPLEGLTVDGFEVWRAGLVLYGWSPDRKVLFRREVPPWPPGVTVPVSSSGPADLTAEQLRLLAPAASSGGTGLVQGVEALAWTWAGEGPRVQGPFTVHLELRARVEGTRETVEETWDRTMRFPTFR